MLRNPYLLRHRPVDRESVIFRTRHQHTRPPCQSTDTVNTTLLMEICHGRPCLRDLGDSGTCHKNLEGGPILIPSGVSSNQRVLVLAIESYSLFPIKLLPSMPLDLRDTSLSSA